jgi:YaiO family outer membrane protein
LSIGTLLTVGVADAISQVVPAPTADSARTRPLDDLRRVAVRYGYDDPSDVEAWHSLSIELAQRLRFGSVIGGLNAARRYEKNGAQLELQAYPFLTARSYLTLIAGWSPSTGVFLPLRLSAEPYYNFANGWETSAGVRYLQTPGPDVYVYTGTLARYVGNYWLSGRPHFSRTSGATSYGWEANGRRYFADRYDYVALRVSRTIGVDPEAVDPQRFTRPARLGGILAQLERRQPMGKSRRATFGVGYGREQIGAGRTRVHRSATAGIEWFVP